MDNVNLVNVSKWFVIMCYTPNHRSKLVRYFVLIYTSSSQVFVICRDKHSLVCNSGLRIGPLFFRNTSNSTGKKGKYPIYLSRNVYAPFGPMNFAIWGSVASWNHFEYIVLGQMCMVSATERKRYMHQAFSYWLVKSHLMIRDIITILFLLYPYFNGGWLNCRWIYGWVIYPTF